MPDLVRHDKKFNMKKNLLTLVIALIIVAQPAAVFASVNSELEEVYQKRTDLQAAFQGETYKGVHGTAAGFLIDLEDWARQYGWREHAELAAYSPELIGSTPHRAAGFQGEPQVGAESYIMIDRQTGQIMGIKNPALEWPIASLTKLATTDVFLDQGVSLSSYHPVTSQHDVGGAKLWVYSGDQFTAQDLLCATLVGSANNAANALAGSTGLSKNSFIKKMNETAEELNLSHTTFVDPTGIELGNISTVREMARFAEHAFDHREIRQFTTTAERYVEDITQGTTKKMTNTNWMLWKPEYDDVYVMGGKTGYLIESGWNLVVSLRPTLYDEDREILMVLFGADSRADSFVDARSLADWAWENHEWK